MTNDDELLSLSVSLNRLLHDMAVTATEAEAVTDPARLTTMVRELTLMTTQATAIAQQIGWLTKPDPEPGDFRPRPSGDPDLPEGA